MFLKLLLMSCTLCCFHDSDSQKTSRHSGCKAIFLSQNSEYCGQYRSSLKVSSETGILTRISRVFASTKPLFTTIEGLAIAD